MLQLLILLLLLLLAQIWLLINYPFFARTCDLVLFGVLISCILRERFLAIGFALLSGLIFDTVSPAPFLSTFLYVSIALGVMFLVPERFLSFHTVLFSAFVSALIFKILVSFVVASIIANFLTYSLIFKLSLGGALAYLGASYLISMRLSKILWEVRSVGLSK